MGAFFKRLARVAVPIAVMTGTGVLESHPETVWLLPVFAAVGKGVRDAFPGSPVAKYFPF